MVMAAQTPAHRKGRTQPTYFELESSTRRQRVYTYNVGSVSLNSKDDGCADYGGDDGANGPEEGQAV